MKRQYSSKELLQRLHEDGWVVKAQRGSHVQLVHMQKKGKVTIPHPNKIMNIKTVKSILRQAGLEE